MYISKSTAQSWAQKFQSEDHKMKTADGKDLKGWFVDRATLDNLLANVNNQQVIGIQVYLATNEDSGEQTIVIGSIVDQSGDNYLIDSNLQDGFHSCPNDCPSNSLI